MGRILNKLNIVSVVVIFFCFAVSAKAATEEQFEQFRLAMIARNCEFRSTKEGQALEKELGFNDALFSEIMLRLALKGEFACPGGCILIDVRCPDDDAGAAPQAKSDSDPTRPRIRVIRRLDDKRVEPKPAPIVTPEPAPKAAPEPAPNVIRVIPRRIDQRAEPRPESKSAPEPEVESDSDVVIEPITESESEVVIESMEDITIDTELPPEPQPEPQPETQPEPNPASDNVTE